MNVHCHLSTARSHRLVYAGFAAVLCLPLTGAVGSAAASSNGAYASAVSSTPAGSAPPIASATPASSSSGLTSGNWSGYAVAGGTHRSVAASWVQPKISCSHTGAVSIWAGLDGQGTKTVEQTGTQAECDRAGGTPRYFAWWEDYPDPESPYQDAVRPGDTMTASVVYDQTHDSYTAKLTNQTLGWTETKSFARYSGATNGSAEVIAEAPLRNGSRVSLADFGSVTFSHAAIDGRTLAAASATTVTMVRSGVTEAVPGALSATGDSFTDTWKHV